MHIMYKHRSHQGSWEGGEGYVTFEHLYHLITDLSPTFLFFFCFFYRHFKELSMVRIENCEKSNIDIFKNVAKQSLFFNYVRIDLLFLKWVNFSIRVLEKQFI